MYDAQVTSRALERAAAVLGFEPEYHSVAEVQRNNHHFQQLLHPETRELLRKLYPDEIQWVRNEWVISQADYNYWSTRYAQVLGWDARLVLFSPNIAQQITLDVWAEAEREGRAISEQALKARQLGKSTVVELAVCHRVQFYPNVNAVVASSNPDKSAKMAEMIERAWEHQPWFLKAKITAYNKGELIEFGEMDSGISIQHGAMITGVARGTTPTVFHGSEMAEWVNPKELIDASLLPAMHESPFMFLVLEGTGRRRHDWWHQKWQYSKAHWNDGKSRLRATFLPWYVGRDIYPTETWVRTRPVPKNWQPEALTLAHAERAQDYVQKNDLLKKYLGPDWRMPREQMWYWEVTREEYQANRALNKFYAEMASDDTEAFQAEGASVFDPDLINLYREHSKQPVGVFGLTGPHSLIHPRLQPTKYEIDRSLPPLPIDQHMSLVPLRFRGTSEENPVGKVYIWEFPQDEEEYGLGVDTSDGIGRDNSAIEALRKGTMHRNDAQVAEFASPDVNAKDLVPWCYALGTLYSRRKAGVHRQAKMVIELERGGNITQLDLRVKWAWRHFHVWMRAYDQKVLDRKRSQLVGWSTNRWSRPQLLITGMEYLRNGWIDINSPWFCDEMGDLEADENTQKIKAQVGAKDDRIMALFMVLFSLHDLEIWKREQPVARRRAESAEQSEVDPVWTPKKKNRDSRGASTAARRVLLPAEVAAEVEEWLE